jgi:glycine dehydrogenase subunit 1
MSVKKHGHPYIPNSAPKVREQMLQEINVKTASQLYDVIPSELKFDGQLDLPEPILSEFDLKKHVENILFKNKNCKEYLSFLGAGCWNHYVPAVCDEINSRAEFLTAYCGDTYSDLGKYQAIFEYQSMMGELLKMEVVSCPTYDWASAISSSLLMAQRITGRRKVLVSRMVSSEKKSHIKNFCKKHVSIEFIDHCPETGLIDINSLESKISKDVAAVYFENPSYIGLIEHQGSKISEIAHSKGALSIVGVDPTSLGILTPPVDYGADIVTGEAQPLGNHMLMGGGLCGFIATNDEEKYVAEYPTILISFAPCKENGEFGFGQCTHDRTSYVRREASPDYIGTSSWLWAITAGVYLALMGPAGMYELGEGIMFRANYAKNLISKLPGVRIPFYRSQNFKEFVVNFDNTGKTTNKINKALLKHKIFGGKNLTNEFPELGNSALYCVTEVHTKEDIERLVAALEEVIS